MQSISKLSWRISFLYVYLMKSLRYLKYQHKNDREIDLMVVLALIIITYVDYSNWFRAMNIIVMQFVASIEIGRV